MNLLPLRLRCYRKLLLQNLSEDYAIQDYQSDAQAAQAKAKRLFAYLDTHTLTPTEKAEILLTIWLLLQFGYRNPDLFTRVTEETYSLLPQLSIINCQPSARRSQLSILNLQLGVANYQFSIVINLLLHLYHETEDEDLLPTIDRLTSHWTEDTMTEEDHYLQQLYEPVALA